MTRLGMMMAGKISFMGFHRHLELCLDGIASTNDFLIPVGVVLHEF